MSENDISESLKYWIFEEVVGGNLDTLRREIKICQTLIYGYAFSEISQFSGQLFIRKYPFGAARSHLKDRLVSIAIILDHRVGETVHFRRAIEQNLSHKCE
jgi:hypothetical protein